LAASIPAYPETARASPHRRISRADLEHRSRVDSLLRAAGRACRLGRWRRRRP